MTDYLWGYNPTRDHFNKMTKDDVTAFYGYNPETVHAALVGLVRECNEAIKTEEWDSDNFAFHEALAALACPKCRGEGVTSNGTCRACKDGGKLPFGYTSAVTLPPDNQPQEPSSDKEGD